MVGREKEIVRHLSEEELDRLLTETDDEKVSKRLTIFEKLTEKLSFASSWITNHLSEFLQKLS